MYIKYTPTNIASCIPSSIKINQSNFYSNNLDCGVGYSGNIIPNKTNQIILDMNFFFHNVRIFMSYYVILAFLASKRTRD